MDENQVLEPICEVVVTGPRTSLLQEMIEKLLNERLVACGQRSDWIHSTFKWRAELEHQLEERVRFHTRVSLVPRIVERVGQLHPYEVPCVIALPVLAASHGYHEWVVTETGRPPPQTPAAGESPIG